jgi:dienelactone hydrolase
VFAYYALPEFRKGPVPAMVLVHGGGGKAFKEWAELWARAGYAAIAMDLAGRGPDGEPLPDGGPDQTHKQKFDDITGGVKNAWPYHAVANVLRAVSLIRSFDAVDAERVGITGISWGGYLTCIVSGLDKRLKAAVPVYGCGFLHENSAWLDTFAKLSPADKQAWVENFDPSTYLPGCAMPILFVNGTNDFAYPLDSYRKSYRLVTGPRTLCVTVEMPHGHPQGWAPPEIMVFADSVLRKGRPVPRFESLTRTGRSVVGTYRSRTPVKGAQLHYTTDRNTWNKRKWHSVDADTERNTVRATLPDAEVSAYFLTVADQRGMIASSEHEELGR